MTNTPYRIAALTAATMLVVVTSAPAAPLAPSKASALVSLFAPGDSTSTCPSEGSTGIPFEQLATNGVRTPFVIPPTMVLIVTAIHFLVLNGPPSTNAPVSISSEMADDPLRFPLAFGTASLDAGGEGGGTILIPTGVRVPAGRTVCIAREGGGLTGGLLFGFLAPDN